MEKSENDNVSISSGSSEDLEFQEIKDIAEELNKECQTALKQMEAMNLDIQQYPKAMSDMLAELKKETGDISTATDPDDEAQKKLTCKACDGDEVETCLVPCGHLLCKTCSVAEKPDGGCPICSQAVEKMQDMKFN